MERLGYDTVPPRSNGAPCLKRCLVTDYGSTHQAAEERTWATTQLPCTTILAISGTQQATVAHVGQPARQSSRQPAGQPASIITVGDPLKEQPHHSALIFS